MPATYSVVPAWVTALHGDTNLYTPDTHVLVVGRVIAEYFLREDLRYADANSITIPIYKDSWCKFRGYNTYVDLELNPTEYFYPYQFFRNEDFVAKYFVDLL